MTKISIRPPFEHTVPLPYTLWFRTCKLWVIIAPEREIVPVLVIAHNCKVESLFYSPDFGHYGTLGKLLLLIQRI